jgi:hypothetical protein
MVRWKDWRDIVYTSTFHLVMIVHRLHLYAGVWVLLAAVGCSSSHHSSNDDTGGDGGADASEEAGPSDPFVGSWVCEGTESLTFTEPKGEAPMMSGFASDVTVTANADGSLTATSEAVDGGFSCALKSAVSGSTATLESGQSCMDPDGTNAVYTSGTATLNGVTFAFSRAFTFSGTLTVMAGAAPRPQGGLPDGGVSDGGSSDGGASEGGVSDGGVSDGGVSDGGPHDGGVSDAGGSHDSGAADGGSSQQLQVTGSGTSSGICVKQ